MTFRFSRLTTALVAAALALTSLTAAPASAMTREERNALGLILGIGAVAVLADGANDHRRAAPAPVRPPMHFEHRDRYDDRRGWHDDRRRGHGHGHGWGYGHRRAETCVVRIERDHRGRRIEVYSPGCDRRGERPYRR